MTMVEKIAQAMYDELSRIESGLIMQDWARLAPDLRSTWINLARIAVRTMREPTPEMLEAMKLNIWAYIEGKWDDDMRAEVEGHEDGWRAAVDAALKEDKA